VLNKTLVATCELLFTARPEAPAFVLAGASGWAVNEKAQAPIHSIPDRSRRSA
jgi:hypothetical protein